jgi:tetratricopeptide (TPR) repeat protein
VRNCAAVQSRPFNIAQALQDAVNLHQRGQLREAEKLSARVLKAAPQNFDALHLLGLAKAQSGQFGEAYRLMSAALKIETRSPDAWINFANVLHALKRHDEALAALDKALALRPGYAEALSKRGNTLLALGRAPDALPCFDTVLAQQPRHLDALINRGSAHATLGQLRKALADFDAALALAPGHPDALYNRGTALLDLARVDEARTAFEAVIAGAPNHALAWNNKGRALQMRNRHAEAVDCFQRAIAIDKTYADAHFNSALSLLLLGEFSRGFAEYEWRWKRSGMSDARSRYRGRLWLGEYPLARKTLLLHAEQGLGDTIQFARYVPLLAATGAKVVLEVQPPLKDLFATLHGATSVCARGETLPAYDVHCPIGSLPFAMKTEPATIPADIPYLRADEARIAKWRPALQDLAGNRVALVWAGNPAHVNDRNRSIDFKLLEPLLAVEGVSFVSLQRDLRAGEKNALDAHADVRQLGDELVDFADTAAVLALSDLLIAVDTAAVHLTGAMGRPAWVMLPFVPDWRWTLADETSPWYPQLRLFRQSTPGDWPTVIAQVRDALTRFMREP